jgi:Zn-dependent peptidase ImmA (M78 family)
MVNDRRLNADSFWFTLFHEIGHIINGDYGISFEKETGEQEEAADKYAENSLIPPQKYKDFLEKKEFDLKSIRVFANQIERDAGIVLGRLQKDGIVGYDDWTMKPLRHKYRVKTT